MWRRAEFIKCPLQFWVNLWVFGIKMTVYTYRIAWYRSFFNFSFVLNKINEILLHQKYIKIIVKNCSKWPVFRVIFLRFFNEILLDFFFHFVALEISFSKLVLHVQKVQMLEDLCSLKVCLWKAKIWAFSSGNTQIFFINKL